MKKKRRVVLPLAGIIFGGFVLRAAMAVAALWTWPLAPDSFGYVKLAQSLAETGRFELDGRAEIFRTPGYPGLLAAEIKASPSGWTETDGYGYLEIFVPALIVQVVLDCVMIGLTFWLGAILASRGTGLLAAGLQAVSPLAIGSCCLILSDSIFAFIFMIGLILLAKFLKGNSWIMLAFLALAAAIECYIRPVGIVFSAVIAAAIIFVKPRQPKNANSPAQPVDLAGLTVRVGIGSRLIKALVFSAIVAACLAPWVIRNIKVADYCGYSSFATDSLFKFSVSRIEAEKSGGNWEKANWDMEYQLRSDRNNPSPGELARARADKAWQVVWENPGRAASLHLKGDAAFFLPGGVDMLQLLDLAKPNRGTLDVIRSEGLFAGLRNYFGDSYSAMLAAVPMALFFLLQIAGLAWCAVKKLRISMPAFAWIVILLVAVSALLPGPCNHPRFRVPFEPIINIAAAIGICMMFRRHEKTVK